MHGRAAEFFLGQLLVLDRHDDEVRQRLHERQMFDRGAHAALVLVQVADQHVGQRMFLVENRDDDLERFVQRLVRLEVDRGNFLDAFEFFLDVDAADLRIDAEAQQTPPLVPVVAEQDELADAQLFADDGLENGQQVGRGYVTVDRLGNFQQRIQLELFDPWGAAFFGCNSIFRRHLKRIYLFVVVG